MKLSNNSSKDQIASNSNHSPTVVKPSTLKKSKLKLNPKQIDGKKHGKVRKMSVIESRNAQLDNESSQDVNKQQSQGPKVDLTKAKEARA